MKILLYNLAYCTGVDGSIAGYAKSGFRHFTSTRSKPKAVVDAMVKLVEQESPDVCCFIEIDSDSELLPRLQPMLPHAMVANKYRSTHICHTAPFFRTKSLAVLSNLPFTTQFHDFQKGTKRLLQAVMSNGFSLFLSHNSLRRHVRSHQIDRLGSLVPNQTKVIACGDFNIFNGVRELTPLYEAGMSLANEESTYTFPAHRPNKLLDLFLHTPDVAVKSVRVLQGVHLSDHLPVMLEV